MCLSQARGSTGCSKRLPFQIDGGHCALGNFLSAAFFLWPSRELWLGTERSCSTGTSFDFMVLFYSCTVRHHIVDVCLFKAGRPNDLRWTLSQM